MLTAVRRVRSYTDGFTFDGFCSDQRTIDAVTRNFEVIGEAARHVDEAIAAIAPAVPWIDIRDSAEHPDPRVLRSRLADRLEDDLGRPASGAMKLDALVAEGRDHLELAA